MDLIPKTILPAHIQRRLLLFAAIFLCLSALALTLSPAARARSFSVDYRWSHWFGLAAWLIFAIIIDRAVRKRLAESDPYLLPVAALLAGWGLLSVWRLNSGSGMRQAVWLIVSSALILAGLRFASYLTLLRRYKYLLLTGGLTLTALTLIFGTNPLGGGPRLWLGCCGVYLQPSEPLKLLLVIYLAAYFADRLPLGLHITTLVAPGAIVTGLALIILIVQRDLGTASIFMFIFAVMLYFAIGRRRVLIGSALGLALAGLVGYFYVGIIQVRIDTWLFPWNDPSGRSYQIIQSLMAIANGGLFGRGPGLGNPGLVPVAISDFIFTSVAEEGGLIGIIALLGCFAIIVTRGMKIALAAPDNFTRLLAAGLSAYLGAQCLLIAGGNLRLLPLTGVTLPFVSYGGSSLVTSFIAILILLIISHHPDDEPAALKKPQPYLLMNSLLLLGLAALAIATGWWSVWRSADLLTRSDNARRAIADRTVYRGAILDRNNIPINLTQGERGKYTRVYLYPDLSPIIGYNTAAFGQNGLEASLDSYLRGEQGNPVSLIWWEHLLYGQPPSGLDIRLSLDLDLQQTADEALGTHNGAVILLNAANGEMLVMASHPTFDPGQSDAFNAAWLTDPSSPLVNRAAQGQYPVPAAMPPLDTLIDPVNDAQRIDLYQRLGFYEAPQARVQVAEVAPVGTLDKLQISPLQMALAAAALSNNGTRPPARIAMAVNSPEQGWIILPALSDSVNAFTPAQVSQALTAFASEGQPFWFNTQVVLTQKDTYAWVIGGTFPGWQGAPLAAVVMLEENNASLAQSILQKILSEAIKP